jgi:peroxiredoxin family protein
MSIIYKKSLKGVEEVALRSSGLQLRLRAYLILVDGTKSAAEIQSLNPGLPEVEMVLAALKDEGYLDISGQASSANNTSFSNTTSQARPSASANQSAPARSNDTFPATTNNMADNAKFIQARENMTREIMSLLGKDAEMVVTKIQRCETSMDLFAMMMGLKKIVTMYTSAAKAEEFGNKFSYISTL